jgi:membrane-bound lytic murein transglycosylase D
MPQETRYYVPKLQALKNIITQPEVFGVQLPEIGNHPFFDTITIDRDIDVALIARLAEVSEQNFRALNPSITLPVVMAAGTPQVLLPWDNAALFETRLREYKGPLASWTAWVVPKTMSAAEVAQRFGMSEIELRRINNIPPRMMVRAGSSLLVPRTGAYDRDIPEHVADNAALHLQPDRAAGKTRRQVTVRKGDSLAAIARRHGVSVANLAKWNGLTSRSKLRAGQRLVVLQEAPSASQAGSSAGASKKPPATASRPKAKGSTPPAAKTRVASKK